MSPLKLNRAFSLAGVTMPSVRAHIEQFLAGQAPALDACTSAQLAGIIQAVNTAYHAGRASTGAEVIDDDALWVAGRLVPLAAVLAIPAE